MSDGLSRLEGEMFLNTADSSDVEVSRFAYSVDVGLEGEGMIKDNTHVSSTGGGVNFKIANLDGGVWGGLWNLEWMGRNSVLSSFSLSEF